MAPAEGSARGNDMQLINGLKYNLRGLRLGLKTPRLLLLGVVRFILVVLVMILFTSLILAHHRTLMDLFWTQPDSIWLASMRFGGCQ